MSEKPKGEGYGGYKSFRGVPPDDHPRRCVGLLRSGERCMHWGLKETNPPKCRRHAASIMRYRRMKEGKDKSNMPKFYKHVLSDALRREMDDVLELSSEEQFNVLEELALIRLAASESVALYSAAKELQAKDPTNKKIETVVLGCGEAMREILSDVVKTAKDAATIHYASKQTFTVWDLKAVVNQISRMMYEVCGEEHQELAEGLVAKIEEKLRLPGEDDGTKISADQDVMDMDATVPHPPIEMVKMWEAEQARRLEAGEGLTEIEPEEDEDE